MIYMRERMAETLILKWGNKMGRNKWGMIIITGMIAITSITGCGTDNVDAAPDVTPSPAQHKQMLMDNAHERGETIFVWDAPQSTKYALYYGANHIVFLKPDMVRTIKLTTNESINLSVRKLVGDDWTTVYSFQNVGPGDYVRYDGSWRVTQYTQ